MYITDEKSIYKQICDLIWLVNQRQIKSGYKPLNSQNELQTTRGCMVLIPFTGKATEITKQPLVHIQ